MESALKRAGTDPTMDLSRLTDAELVRQAITPDDEAFEALCRRYLPKLRRRALGMTRDHDLASECVQQTLIRLHRGLKTFDPDRNFKPWVLTILTNTLRSLWAQSKRVVFMDEGLDAMVRPGDLSDPWAADPQRLMEASEEAAQTNRKLDALSSCVEDLPHTQRGLYELVFVDQLNHKDAAEVLQISHDNCRQRSVRIRRSLKLCVEGKLKEGNSP